MKKTELSPSSLVAAVALTLSFFGSISHAQSWRRAATDMSVPGNSLQGIAVTDLNGDGAGDIVLSVDKQLVVYLGDGKGNFSPAPKSASPVGVSVDSFSTGNFTGYGNEDLMLLGSTPGSSTADELLLYAGNGDGTFGAAVQLGTNSLPSFDHSCSVYSGSFLKRSDNSTLSDIAIYCKSDPGSYYLGLNQGNGQFIFSPQVAPFRGKDVRLFVGDVLGKGHDALVFFDESRAQQSPYAQAIYFDAYANPTISVIPFAGARSELLARYDGEQYASIIGVGSGGLFNQHGTSNGFGDRNSIDTIQGRVYGLAAGRFQSISGDVALDFAVAHLDTPRRDAKNSEFEVSFYVNTARTQINTTPVKRNGKLVSLYAKVVPFSGNTIPLAKKSTPASFAQPTAESTVSDGSVALNVDGKAADTEENSSDGVSLSAIVLSSSDSVSASYSGSDINAASARPFNTGPGGTATVSLVSESGNPPDFSVSDSCTGDQSGYGFGFTVGITGSGSYSISCDYEGTSLGSSCPGAPTLPSGSYTATISGHSGGSCTTYTATGSVSFTIQKATPSLSISCSPVSITYGAQTTTCTPTVSGGSSPTGTLTWTYDNTGSCPGNAWTSGSLTASQSGFNEQVPGTWTVCVAYSGDGNNNAVSSSTSFSMVKASPTGSISCTPTTLVAGGSNITTCTVNMNAVSEGATPTGSVSVYWNGNTWASPALSNGSVSVTGLNAQPAQTVSVTGSYNGDGNYNSVSLSGTTVTIIKATPSFSISCSGDNTFGQVNVNCTPSVSGGDSPSGTISWGYSTSGSCTPGSWATNESLTQSVGNWAGYGVANISVCAEYVGDLNNNAVTASTSFVIEPASGSLTITGPASGTVGGSGSITFSGAYDGAPSASSATTSVCTVNGNTVTYVSAGTCTLNASVTSTNYTSATAAAYSFQVASAAPTSLNSEVLSLASNPNPSTAGQDVIFTGIASTGGSSSDLDGYANLNYNGNVIGAPTVQVVTTTNLVPYSEEVGKNSPWSGYCGTTNATYDTTAVAAPDGSNTATLIQIPTWSGTFACGQTAGVGFLTSIVGGMQVGSTYTASVWLRGANGGETVALGFDDGYGVWVTLTTSWQRYTYTATYSADDGEQSRGFQVLDNAQPGAAFYVWGAQTEVSASVGPYILTQGGSASGSGAIFAAGYSSLPVGSDEVALSYYYAAQSVSVTQQVAQATPTLSVSCSPNPIGYGSQTTTCTPSLTGGDSPTGTLTWTINGSAWAAANPGSLTSSPTGLSGYAPGQYTIGVTYSGDSNNSSVSASTTVTIKTVPTLTVSCSPNPVAMLSSFTCTSSLSSGTGTESWSINGGSWGTTDVNGSVTETVSTSSFTPEPGTYPVVVTYSGDSENASVSATVNLTYGALTETQVTSSENPSTAGQNVTYTALISTGGAAPTGTVNFTNGSTALGSATVSPVTTTNLIPDSGFNYGSTYWSLTEFPIVYSVAPDGGNGLVYTGNGSASGYLWDTSSVISVTPGATYTLSGYMDASAVTSGSVDIAVFDPTVTTGYAGVYTVAGQPTQRYSVTFTVPSGVTQVVVICDTSNATVSNGGRVIWSDLQLEQSSSEGPYVVTTTTSATGSGGIASFSYSELPAGSDTITATYSGDTNDSSSSGSMVQTVNLSTPSLTANCDSAPLQVGGGEDITCSVTVSGSGPTPTGTVDISFNGSSRGSLTLSNGAGTISPSCTNCTLGSNTASFSYSGDSNYSAANTSVTFTITQATPSCSWPTASPIQVGQALSASTLSSGSCSVPGSFAWTSPSTTPPAGIQSESVTFTPTNTTDFTNVTGSTSVTTTLANATVTISSSMNPSAYGNGLIFTITVTGETGFATPTGTVTIYDIGSCTSSCTGVALGSNLPLSGGTTSFQSSVLAGGQHNLVVIYSGDGDYEASAPMN